MLDNTSSLVALRSNQKCPRHSLPVGRERRPEGCLPIGLLSLSDTSTVALGRLDERVGQAVNDSSGNDQDGTLDANSSPGSDDPTYSTDSLVSSSGAPQPLASNQKAKYPEATGRDRSFRWPLCTSNLYAFCRCDRVHSFPLEPSFLPNS
jgi:hypothetical protein